MHGGRSTRPTRPYSGNTNAVTHGGYVSTFTGEQKERMEEFRVNLGQVDDELLIARMQLSNVLEAQEEVLSKPNDPNVGMELSEVEESTVASGSRTREVSRRPDYWAIIDTCLGRIARLETVRMNLKLELIDGLQAKLEALLQGRALALPEVL